MRKAIAAIPEAVYEAVGMRKVDRPLFEGRVFYPIGHGYLGSEFPHGGVMMLGSEWGTEGNVEDDLDPLTPFGKTREEKESDATWLRALDLIAGVDSNGTLGLKRRAWFTNFAMGVRAGSGSNSKVISPWFRLKEPRPNDYVMRCKAIFELQLLRQQPCAVVAFGKPVAITLARLYPEALGRWDKERFPDRDKEDGAAIHDVALGSCNVPLIVSIVHPSKWRLNVEHRRFRGLEGDAVERELFKLVGDRLRRNSA